MHARLRRFLRPLCFAGVGVLNTLIDVTLFTLLVAHAVHPVLANTVSYSSGIVTSFTLNGRLTFGLRWRELASLRRFAAFCATAMVSLAASNLVVALLAGPIGPVPAKLVSLIASFGLNYSLGGRFAFASDAA